MPDPSQPEVIINSPTPFQLPLKLIGQALASLLVVLLLIFLLAPLDLYLNLNSMLYPHALAVDNTPIPWEILKKEVILTSFDKSLKTRQQKLETAMDKAVELQILRASIATPSAFSKPLTLFAEHRVLKDQIEQNLVNWRTGGFFIAKFLIPEATESAQVLQDKAKTEIVKLQQKLKTGADIKTLIKEAEENPTLSYLNRASYLPGMYLEKITPDKFPLHFTTVRDSFFSLKENEVSDIITLKSDDFYDPHDQNSSFELAYVVLRVDKANPQDSADFNEWIEAQKKKVAIQSNVLVPPFFKWF